MEENRKIYLITGHYGSGKTNFAVNLALDQRKQGKTVTLVDLDIVNPFFRSSEHEDYLKSLGIAVVKPNFANTTVDVPSLPAEIYSAFDREMDAVAPPFRKKSRSARLFGCSGL